MILGAGAAGLAAAAHLSSRDLSVRVIEARDRLGGRVWTWHDAAPCLGVDVGAEFVHGAAQPLADVAHLADVALIDVRASHWERRGGGLVRSSRFEKALDAALEKIGRLVRSGRDMTLSQALDAARVRGGDRDVALSFVQGFHAADPDAISARSLASTNEGAERIHRVLGGLGQVTTALFQRVQDDAFRLGTAAKRVRFKKGGATIECEKALDSERTTLHAKRVIVTLPLPLLAFASDGAADGRVVFSPVLEEKERAAKRLVMGNVAKIVLRFRESFWTDRAVVRTRPGSDLEQIGFIHSPHEPFPIWWTMYPVLTNIVTGWAGGPACKDLLKLAPGDLAVHAAGAFARALGIAPALVERQLMAFWFHDWSADPCSRGAYSYPRAGGVHAGRALREPVGDTLFFAGEATCDPPDNGTVHGAIASGLRAANEVLASYDHSAR